ncbi:hypothetical protein L208DRAFT_1496921 [Tricholoma matsutake]|nr:hypothetical protein L208DRAFT_1496921 [Tricholoma matsutake 945]
MVLQWGVHAAQSTIARSLSRITSIISVHRILPKTMSVLWLVATPLQLFTVTCVLIPSTRRLNNFIETGNRHTFNSRNGSSEPVLLTLAMPLPKMSMSQILLMLTRRRRTWRLLGRTLQPRTHLNEYAYSLVTNRHIISR